MPAAVPMDTKSRCSCAVLKWPPKRRGAFTRHLPWHSSVSAHDPMPAQPPPMIPPGGPHAL